MGGPGRIFLFAVAAFISLPLGGGRATAQTAGAETGIEGRWAGVLGGQLHLVVTITKAGSGELGGTMNSVDQHAVLALSNVTLKGDAVRFEAPRVGGVYEGKLSKDGGKLSAAGRRRVCRRSRSISNTAPNRAPRKRLLRRSSTRRNRSERCSTV